MRKLTGTSYFQMLQESAKKDNGEIEEAELEKAYQKFVRMVGYLAEHSHPHTKALFCIFYAKSELKGIQVLLQRSARTDMDHWLEKTCALLDDAEKLIRLRLDYPVINERNQQVKSNLLWPKEQSLSNLVQLLKALSLLGIGDMTTGKKAALKEIVQKFEWLFNVKINNYDQLWAAIATKHEPASFIDYLKHLILEETMK